MRNTSSDRRRETAEEINAGRQEAGKQLFKLFGGTDAAGEKYDGFLHQYRIPDLEKSPEWKTLLDSVRRDPHAKTLAVVMSARNNPQFPPALVAELFSNEEKEQDTGWFANVFLAGAAEIYAKTCKGLILPTGHASLDLVRSAFNLVDHLTEEERKSLNLSLPEESPKRSLATDLAGLLNEATAIIDEPGLTAAQRFYRWAIRRWEDREEAIVERRRQREANAGGKTEETNILPPAPAPASSAKTKQELPAPPAAPPVSAAPDTAKTDTTTQETAPPPAPPIPPAPVTTPSTKPNGKDQAAPAPSITDTDEMGLDAFVSRVKATGLEKTERVQLVNLFRSNRPEAIRNLQALEAVAD